MGMKLKGLEGKAPNGDINVTPLIDVVLALLIIFMVLTPIIIEEMAVNLPQKTEKVETDDLPKDQLLVAACPDGSFTLNRKQMALEQLTVEVRKGLRRKKSKSVFVDGHPDAGYGNMVQLMDAVREAGADKIGLAKLKSDTDFMACTVREATPALPVEPPQ
jgi:biopolymer transport protein ExbD/biopolymer transport protein TolR